MELSPGVFSVSNAIEYVMSMVRERASAHNISLQVHVGADVGEIETDELRFKQIVLNLVGNAVKFSPKGTVTVIRTRVENGSVILEICDSGPGLTEEDMEHAFMKYARLSNKPTGGESSSGLGLAICKQMIDLHNGKIGVFNNPERGATFWFSIPVN